MPLFRNTTLQCRGSTTDPPSVPIRAQAIPRRGGRPNTDRLSLANCPVDRPEKAPTRRVQMQDMWQQVIRERCRSEPRYLRLLAAVRPQASGSGSFGYALNDAVSHGYPSPLPNAH
jgi:hypothetical protein